MFFYTPSPYKTKTLRHRFSKLTVLLAFSVSYVLAIPSAQLSQNIVARRTNSLFCTSPFVSPLEFFSVTYLQIFFTLKVLTFSFSGKGHKLVKNKYNNLTFSFGHSHLYYIYNPQSVCIFRTKTRGFFLGLTRFIVRLSFLSLYQAKPLNIFTSRGVRARSQLIFKKVGKLSLYM